MSISKSPFGQTPALFPGTGAVIILPALSCNLFAGQARAFRALRGQVSGRTGSYPLLLLQIIGTPRRYTNGEG